MHLETCVALLKHRLERPDQERILTVAQKLKADIAEWAAFWSRPTSWPVSLCTTSRPSSGTAAVTSQSMLRSGRTSEPEHKQH